MFFSDDEIKKEINKWAKQCKVHTKDSRDEFMFVYLKENNPHMLDFLNKNQHQERMVKQWISKSLKEFGKGHMENNFLQD